MTRTSHENKIKNKIYFPNPPTSGTGPLQAIPCPLAPRTGLVPGGSKQFKINHGQVTSFKRFGKLIFDVQKCVKKIPIFSVSLASLEVINKSSLSVKQSSMLLLVLVFIQGTYWQDSWQPVNLEFHLFLLRPTRLLPAPFQSVEKRLDRTRESELAEKGPMNDLADKPWGVSIQLFGDYADILNRPTSDFIASSVRNKIFTTNWLWIGVCQNVPLIHVLPWQKIKNLKSKSR